ncbi:MAG: aminotransferase class V-fold PLP-dependent enzyme [Sphaerochaetaceae bacterium]|jgi:cysteine desulfurase family protein
MDRIYLDTASTSFPKAPGVAEAMANFILSNGCNINRGGYAQAYEAEELVFDTRERIASLFDFPKPDHVVFTANVTTALNFIIKGLFGRGDHVLVTSMEHNAVMRPLVQMERHGVSFSRIPCTSRGELETETIESLIKTNTKAIIMTHASNVCGTVMPVAEVARIAHRHGLYLVVDAAQTAGILPIDMQAMGIDILCFTGHKGLGGPQGTGGFLISEALAQRIEPLISGGTGSMSDSEEVPVWLPDRFEAGTMNLPGIAGLHAALDSIRYDRHEDLSALFLEGLRNIAGAKLVGRDGTDGRLAVFGVDFPDHDNAYIAAALEERYAIMTRVGLHCAPNAHKTLGTFPKGLVRFSFGPATTETEIETTLAALRSILNAGK